MSQEEFSFKIAKVAIDVTNCWNLDQVPHGFELESILKVYIYNPNEHWCFADGTSSYSLTELCNVAVVSSTATEKERRAIYKYIESETIKNDRPFFMEIDCLDNYIKIRPQLFDELENFDTFEEFDETLNWYIGEHRGLNGLERPGLIPGSNRRPDVPTWIEYLRFGQQVEFDDMVIDEFIEEDDFVCPCCDEHDDLRASLDLYISSMEEE